MVLTAKNIKKIYNDKVVLRDVSETVGSGKILYLKGESGAGKTTFLRMIMGLEKADSGELFFSKENGDKAGDISIGASFQEDRLCEDINAFTNIKIANPGVKDKDIASDIEGILQGLDDKKTVSKMSGGMRKRISIIRACISERDLYILDEPFTGLDKDNIQRVAEYIKEKTENGILIMTGHNDDLSDVFGDIIELQL